MAANTISGLNGAQTSTTTGNDDMTSLSSKSSSSSSSSCDDTGIDEHSIMLVAAVGDFDTVPGGPGGRASYSASSATTLQVRPSSADMRLSLDVACQLCSSAVPPMLLQSAELAIASHAGASRIGVAGSPSSSLALPHLSPGGTSTTSGTHGGGAPRYRLMAEGDAQVCRLNHTRTIVSKIMNSRYLRRWEVHRLVLGQTGICSTTPTGFMETPLSYASVLDVQRVSRWDIGNKYCLRITVVDGSLLLQTNNCVVRDQWMHSIQWKRYVSRYDQLLVNDRKPDVMLQEIKQLVDVCLTTPLVDSTIQPVAYDLISLLLHDSVATLSEADQAQVVAALSPLLENSHQPTQQMIELFSKHCCNSPRSPVILDIFRPVVHRILKHNVDFGRHARKRMFAEDYMAALSCSSDGLQAVRQFVTGVHSNGRQCPHPRVLPNLVAVCLAYICTFYEPAHHTFTTVHVYSKLNSVTPEQKLETFLTILQTVCSYEDWRPQVASLLQPIPFPNSGLSHGIFTRNMKQVLQYLVDDPRCEVHQAVLGVREGRDGWFDVFCPGGVACFDDGQTYQIMLQRLIGCCCRRRAFIEQYSKMIGPWQLLALRENDTAIDVLCAVLEFDLCSNADLKMQIVTTLQSSGLGRKAYGDLSDRLTLLRELQQKGGPRKMTLPARSTDADVARLLSNGSFGNLEYLSLAFTNVTSACAHDLIKLPQLRYLSFWSTQFGDTGLQLLSEHMHRLQVLNLCETPVTDKGLSYLSAMKSLKKLNLNSTHLSALTFEGLKEKLPSLKECDIRYTDAW